ncbi:hypothetical protein SLNSH_18570 [Alsobacter soli]|uniref:Phosphate starvation-inducible protein PsiF n=1 Tax=Alsobacter soli TaxID=2109933 RepID=A0A2T1HPG5_9HYPH|nr:hypothetical protein [Alsobacter soli]PSC03516.1 hypothetical protein SLNSH_18570 [Alsobacter soli]
MRSIALAAALVVAMGGSAFAQAASCKAQATEKKLAGAALNSFMKKCQTDAAKTCDTSASEKKLSGAAKTSFTKKCVTDAVGT